MGAEADNDDPIDASDDVPLLPADIPVGWYVLDAVTDVWVEVTGEPVTIAGITSIPVIDGFNVPLIVDAHEPIMACPGTSPGRG